MPVVHLRIHHHVQEYDVVVFIFRLSFFNFRHQNGQNGNLKKKNKIRRIYFIFKWFSVYTFFSNHSAPEALECKKYWIDLRRVRSRRTHTANSKMCCINYIDVDHHSCIFDGGRTKINRRNAFVYKCSFDAFVHVLYVCSIVHMCCIPIDKLSEMWCTRANVCL